MDVMSNLQTLSSNTSFRELLRKFRQEETSSSSFMSWLIPTEDPSSSSSFWWENNFEAVSGDSSTYVTSPRGECATEKPYNASSSPHWLAYEDQDTVSLSCSSSDEEGSYEASISSASSVYSDEEDEKYFIEEEEEYLDQGYYEEDETYLPALGWWKVYRSGWWEDSEGASTHFDDTYVEYRYSALLPSILESNLEEATSP